MKGDDDFKLPELTEEHQQAIRDLLGPLTGLSKLGIPVAPMDDPEEDPGFLAFLAANTRPAQPPAEERKATRQRHAHPASRRK